ncbi:MAG: hypothetical protein WBS24_08640 [Terriglobales bacterium]
MHQLCGMIEKEKDPKTFLRLIRELNELLERQQQRLEGGNYARSSSEV